VTNPLDAVRYDKAGERVMEAAARLAAYRDLYDALERELVGDDLLP